MPFLIGFVGRIVVAVVGFGSSCRGLVDKLHFSRAVASTTVGKNARYAWLCEALPLCRPRKEIKRMQR